MHDPFNPAQRNALKQAYLLLGEHFDRCLIVVDCVIEDEQGTCDAHEACWNGGSMAAIGMAEFARNRILAKPLRADPPE